MLKVCIDTNIWISGILFSGKPAQIVTAAFNREFELVLSRFILDELSKNLMNKFKFDSRTTKKLIGRILQIADLYEPTDSVREIPNRHSDNLVLETAMLGRAKYLVTGDREHLLPLKIFRHVKIINATDFVNILKEKY